MRYAELSAWVRVHNLVMNRVKCMNDVTEDLFTVRGKGPTYRLSFAGSEVVTWRAYDMESCERALAACDALLDVLWNARRLGYACFL